MELALMTLLFAATAFVLFLMASAAFVVYKVVRKGGIVDAVQDIFTDHDDR